MNLEIMKCLIYIAFNETDSRLQTKKSSNSYRHESHISEKQIADIHLPWQRFGTRINSFFSSLPSFEKFVGFLHISSRCSYQYIACLYFSSKYYCNCTTLNLLPIVAVFLNLLFWNYSCVEISLISSVSSF